MTDDFRIVTEASSRGNKTNRRDALRQVIQEIKSMTGLRKVKTQLQELMNFAQVVAIRRDRDLPEPSLSLHMVFTGSPGTGKTVIARKVGKLLNAIGLLQTDKFVEADRSRTLSVIISATQRNWSGTRSMKPRTGFCSSTRLTHSAARFLGNPPTYSEKKLSTRCSS